MLWGHVASCRLTRPRRSRISCCSPDLRHRLCRTRDLVILDLLWRSGGLKKRGSNWPVMMGGPVWGGRQAAGKADSQAFSGKRLPHGPHRWLGSWRTKPVDATLPFAKRAPNSRPMDRSPPNGSLGDQWIAPLSPPAAPSQPEPESKARRKKRRGGFGGKPIRQPLKPKRAAYQPPQERLPDQPIAEVDTRDMQTRVRMPGINDMLPELWSDHYHVARARKAGERRDWLDAGRPPSHRPPPPTAYPPTAHRPPPATGCLYCVAVT